MGKRVKVSFPMSSDEGSMECMYAQAQGDGVYVLDNSPFYAFDISYCDEFVAKEVNGGLVFSHVVSRSGHSTYRIKIPKNKKHTYFLKYWKKLKDEGCSYEGSSVNSRRLYAIDVPPAADINKVYGIMEDYEQLGIWEFEEGHCYDGDRNIYI